MSTSYDKFRQYDTFEKRAIANNQFPPENLSEKARGWQDYSADTDDDGYADAGYGATPVDAENLNAMLNMLIYIRNVIGKTSDFAKSVNGVDLYKTLEEDKETEDIENSVYPNPNYLDHRSIAKYLGAAFNAIIGSSEDSSSLTKTLTLNSIKNYLEHLDYIDCGSSDDVIDNGGDN